MTTIIHMLPGAGKTWLTESFPELFEDGDVLYERSFPGQWKGRVHLLDIKARRLALRSKKAVLTNDHAVADIGFVHDNLQSYLERASPRADLRKEQLTEWYNQSTLAGFDKLVEDPQQEALNRARNFSERNES